MANHITNNDAYVLMSSIVSQATGQSAIAVTDTTSFVSAGETALRTGAENVLNAISAVVSRTIFSVRPYRRKLDILTTTPERWGAQVRKITPLYMGYEETTDDNTIQNATTLSDGASIDMFVVNSPKAIQLNFYGSNKLQKSITRYRDQLSKAFHNETEFMAFIDSIMTEYANEIELANENRARLTVNNFIGGIYNYADTRTIDLVAEYNTKYNTTYTRDDLLTTYLESFMKFVAATIKTYSSRFTDYTALYHSNITGYNKILRHTPKARQRMLMYSPFFIEMESELYSSLFNPEYLEIGDFEGVNFWQNPSAPTEIKVLPNILNETTGQSEDAAANVEIDYVLGMLFDEEAIGILPQFDYTSTTPFNSAGGYWNMFTHWRFNSFNDYTENAIIFVLGAGGV